MVRGTFSPARAWRPAVGYRLAQTLGSTRPRPQLHGKQPPRPNQAHALPPPVSPTERWLAKAQHDCKPQLTFGAGVSAEQSKHLKKLPWAASRHNRAHQCTARAIQRALKRNTPNKKIGFQRQQQSFQVSCACLQRQPQSQLFKYSRTVVVQKVLPNPSLNRSADGRPPGPGWWYAVHFHQPGPGVLPSAPG